MKLTPAELTVLALIVERPQHGYDIEQTIDARSIRDWMNIGFSSIYYLLAKLEKWGLLAVLDAPATPTSRRVFHATEAGRAAAVENARALIEDVGPTASPIIVGMVNASLLDPEGYTTALRARLASVRERMETVARAQNAPSHLGSPANEMLSYSLAILEAEESWLLSRTTDRRTRRLLWSAQRPT